MDSDNDALTRVLALMRAGASVRVGGGRWNETFSFRAGGWYSKVFDEGAFFEGASSEDQIRATYARDPAPFLALLGEPFWEALASALIAGDRDGARAWLEQGRACGARDLDILSAFLAWPEESPSSEVRQRVERAISEQRAASIFLAAVLQRHGDVVAMRGVEFMNALGAMAGEPLHFFGQRAEFRVRAGDIDGAIADFQREVDRIPEDASEATADGLARRNHLQWLAELRARKQR
jgi:hypothetical protein